MTQPQVPRRQIASRLRSLLVILCMTIGLSVGLTGTSSASTSFQVAWTKIGIYPKTSPSMDASRAGAAVSDGTWVTVECEQEGQSVTSDVGTSSIWERTNIGWLPNSYIYTGVDGWTPGIPNCSSQASSRPPQASQPSDSINVPSPETAPRGKATKSGIAPVGYAELLSECGLLNSASAYLSASMCYHYADQTGTVYQIDMGNLIWTERPLWASLEWHLRNQVSESYSPLQACPTSEACVRSFDTGWQAYTATGGDWALSLHSFNFRVFGDIWIGPVGDAGVRQVQIRYRSAMYDVYDFDPASKYKDLYDAATKGWATEFYVKGDTKVVTTETDTTHLSAGALPFAW